MKKLLFILVWLLLVGFSSGYTIEGNTVIQEDAFSKLLVYPHTVSNIFNNQTQFFELTNKTASMQQVFLAYKFNEPIQQGKILKYNEPVFDWIELYYNTCNPPFEYVYVLNENQTENPHWVKCFQVLDGNAYDWNSLKFETTFSSGNFDLNTVNKKYYQKVSGDDYTNYSDSVTQVEYLNDYYYYLDDSFNLSAGNTIKWKINYTPSLTDTSKKWELVYYTGAHQACILDDSCTYVQWLDPWWSTIALTRYPINISMTGTTSDVNTTFKLKTTVTDLGLTVSSDLNRIVIIDQDGNVEIGRVIDFSSVTGDLNIFFKPRIPLALNTDYNGSDTNGLMIYVVDLNYSDQNDSWNDVFWWGSNFEITTERGDWNSQLDADTWTYPTTTQKDGSIGTVKRVDFVSAPQSDARLNNYLFPLSADWNVFVQADINTSYFGKIAFHDPGISDNVNQQEFQARTITNLDFLLAVWNPVVTSSFGTSTTNTWYTMLWSIDDSNQTGSILGEATKPTLRNTTTWGEVFALKLDGVGTPFSEWDNIRIYKILTNQPILTVGAGVSGKSFLRLNFKDENTGAPLDPTTLTLSINGSDANDWSDNVSAGQLDINTSHFDSGKWEFTYTLDGYGTRTFMQDINNELRYNFTLGLLQDINGSNINFKFFNQSGSSILADANIEVVDSAGKIAGRNTTGTDGTITFFLNPNDGGYQFNINDVNGSDYSYTATQLTVKIPLDEADLSQVSPFNIKKRGVGARDFNNLSADFNIAIYANTINFYQLIVGDQNTNYFNRGYFIKLTGQVNQRDLQPYLVKIETGVSSQIVITVKDRFTKETLIGAFLTIRKQLSGSGLTTVELAQTDDSGRVQIAVILGDEYTIDINFGSSLFTKTLKMIDTGGFTLEISVASAIDTNFSQKGFTVNFTPTGNNFILVDGNYNIKADVNSDSNNMKGITFVIRDSTGNNLVYEDQNSVNGLSFVRFDVNIASTSDQNVLYYVEVTITDLDGVIYNQTLDKAYEIKRSVGGELWDSIKGVFSDFLGERLSLFLLVLIAAFSTGGLSRFTGNQDIQVGFAAGMMGFFVLIGGVDQGLWAIATAFMVLVMLIRGRGIGNA